ncbi:MAG TPA: histidine kinase dimerization/phosphoacceptor domain -containing protein [Saprospiraceae bacterium]|nr:histidine kinase dimerization/phosphoacceptor domain -containing protein [Saprospiraceae bacterium]
MKLIYVKPITSILLGLFLSANYGLTQSLEELPLDSLLQWVSDNAYGVYTNNNAPEVHHYACLSLRRAKKNNTIPEIVEACQNLALVHYVIEDEELPDSTLFYDQMALDYLLKTDDQKAIASAYTYVGNDYASLGDYESAQSNLLKGLEIYDRIADLKGVARAYKNLSFLYRESKDYNRAIEYGEKGIEIAKTLGIPDSVDLGISWFYLVDAYVALEQSDKALKAANNSIQLIEPYAATNPFALVRAYSYRSTVYKDKNKYDLALKDAFYAWEFAKSNVSDESTVGGFQQEIATILRLQEKCEEAIPYFEGFFETMIERDASNSLSLSSIHLGLADCYEQTGDYPKALKHQKIAAQLRDTLNEERYKSLESELIQKYESEQKDEQISLQTATIQQQKQIQYLSFGIGGLLTILLAGLFLTYRNNRQKSRQLDERNAQNELLLKEIHHRVKNNLQTISSLLSLQSESISNKSAFDAIQESKNRVSSMALLHQKLYQGENLAAIEMRDYFETIGETIVDSFGEKAENVSLKIDMSELELDVDTAVPIGLITNELITNSLKYAFPNKQKGQISITLTSEENGLLKLNIADNGQATQEESSSKKDKGFGTLLIQLLTTQLGGKLETSTAAGTSTIIQFPLQQKSVA